MIKNSVKYEESVNGNPPDELDPLGKGLNVLITSDYKFQYNWMSFAAWYSVAKNLPHATVGLTVARPSKLERYLFNWVYKLDVKFFMHKNVGEKYNLPYLNKLYGVYVALKEGVLRQPLLVIESDMMALSPLSTPAVATMRNWNFVCNRSPYNTSVGPIWYFNNTPLEKLEEAIHNLKTGSNRDHLDLEALAKVFADETRVVDDLGNESQDQDVTAFTHYRERVGSFVKKDWEKGMTLPPFHVCRTLGAGDMTVSEKKVIALWGRMANLYDSVNQVKP